MSVLRRLISHPYWERWVTTLIVINAITLGLETSETAMARAGGLLVAIDRIILAIFVAEIGLRMAVHRWRFFTDPWSIFDTIVVGIALVPATTGLSVLRALRILRVLRLISVVPSLKRVIGALFEALPGMGSIVVLIALVFYVFSVMATKLFGGTFPDWFGNIGASAYTLFQVMTLESWSMGIVRPVMEVYPFAWAFFVPFILLTSFVVLNLFIGIVVSAMQSEHDKEMAEEREIAAREARDDAADLHAEMRALRADLTELRRGLKPSSRDREEGWEKG